MGIFYLKLLFLRSVLGCLSITLVFSAINYIFLLLIVEVKLTYTIYFSHLCRFGYIKKDTNIQIR